MTDTNDSDISEIKLYGLDNNPKTCKNCHRLNHSSNTICWYCDKRLEK